MTETSAAEFSALARDVYNSSGKGTNVLSWTRQNFRGDPTNGFFAAAYRTPRTNRLVVAFRGTQFDSLIDWENNVTNTIGLAGRTWDSQLNTAVAYFRCVRALYPSENCAVCGHSLGGFLASMVAIKEGVLGVTFNPAPLGASGLESKVRSTFSGKTPRLVNFRLKGDLVSGLRQYNIGPVIELTQSKLACGLAVPVCSGTWSMDLMYEAVLLHPNSNQSPEKCV